MFASLECQLISLDDGQCLEKNHSVSLVSKTKYKYVIDHAVFISGWGRTRAETVSLLDCWYGHESVMFLSAEQRQSLLIREGALTGISTVMAQALGIKAGRCLERGLVAVDSARSLRQHKGWVRILSASLHPWKESPQGGLSAYTGAAPPAGFNAAITHADNFFHSDFHRLYSMESTFLRSLMI